ncbi:zinc finger protein RFP-like isoform X2 [Rhineura floridana]|uniref:zinc finger protein RFP-like isoform X2 n=1 Tax=Rhineura floridana TaxID=261503 RepID=UPI002AC82366|nr:zinc finger protein RFP-like isoform X2 [Rhineura floridana]
MAAEAGPMEGLCGEATCPLCLDFFKDPVTLDCGHNFCQGCLTSCWGESDGDSSCPECQETVPQRNFRPNRQLANVAELVKKLQDGKGGAAAVAQETWRMCERHQEPLKLFCKDDQVPICVVCDRSKEHRAHSVFPMEEASQEYKEKINAHLESLKDEREQLVEQKLAEELRRQKCGTELEMEKQKIQSAFERMQEFLRKKLNLWLDQLCDLEEEVEKIQEESISKLSEEISRLDELITVVEEKSLQPASVFLQDIGNALNRNEKNSAQHMIDLSLKLEEIFRIVSVENSTLEKALENYQESLDQALNKVSVTLDPDTASPKLFLSEDLKSVRRAEKKQDLPDNPERFDSMPFVLGREGFTSGRHWWDVEIEMVEKAMWAVGAAKDSVRRKGPFRLNPNEGIWALKKQFGDSSPFELVALNCPEPITLAMRQQLKKIRVAVDYEGGLVEFLDADTNRFIFTFYSGSFCGEKIRPFFHLGLGVNLKC